MKQRKNLKKLLSLIVSAVMLFSVLSIGAMAAGSVPTSDVYTIDGDTIYILKNTFVGDFLRRINSHNSVKKVVDATTKAEVNYGFVTDAMELKIGETSYKIVCQDGPVLYDMATLLADEELKDGDVIFNATKTAGVKFSTNFADTSDLFKKIFISGSYPTEPNEGEYLKITVRKPENEKAYLEFETTMQSPMYLLSHNFPNYANKKTYGQKIVSELDIKGIEHTGSVENASGYFGMTHYFTGNINGEGDTAMAGYFIGDANNSDYVALNDRFFLTMGGGIKADKAASSMYIAKGTAFENNSEVNVRQVMKIFDPEKVANSGVEISGLYLGTEKLSGTSTYNTSKTFNLPVKDGVTNLTNMKRGAISIAVNRNAGNYGEKTIVKLYNYSVYIVDSLSEELAECTGTTYNSLTNTGSEKNGYTYSLSSPRGIKGILPGTTVKELIETIDDALPKHCLSFVGTVSNSTPVPKADSTLVEDGMYLQLVAGGATSFAARSYTLSLATVEDATKSVEGTTLTASRECSNTVLGTFVFAAYDSTGKLIETKTTTTADAEGVRSVTFDTPASEIASVKSFVFNNMTSLRPVVDNTAAN